MQDRATFEQGDIFEKDFSDATVVTLFLLPDLNLRLRPTLLDMAPGKALAETAAAAAERVAPAEIPGSGPMSEAAA